MSVKSIHAQSHSCNRSDRRLTKQAHTEWQAAYHVADTEYLNQKSTYQVTYIGNVKASCAFRMHARSNLCPLCFVHPWSSCPRVAVFPGQVLHMNACTAQYRHQWHDCDHCEYLLISVGWLAVQNQITQTVVQLQGPCCPIQMPQVHVEPWVSNSKEVLVTGSICCCVYLNGGRHIHGEVGKVLLDAAQ